MSLNFYVDSTFVDFRVSGGKIVVTRGLDSIAQQIRVALQTNLSEWFLDVNVGLPIYNLDESVSDSKDLIWTKSIAETTSLIRKIILEVPGVISIQELTVDELTQSNRQLKINTTVEAKKGEINGIGVQDVGIIVINDVII